MTPILLALSLLWSDSIEVKNGLQPESKPMTLKFYEEMRVVPDSDKDYTIWAGFNVSVDADPKGNMYVVDETENRILVFNPDGEFVRQIGREGQGPGEFQALNWFKFLADGTAIAFENIGFTSVFNYYDADVEFKKRRTINEGVGYRDMYPSPSGKLMFADIARVDPETNKEISEYCIVNKDLKKLHTMNTIAVDPADPARVADPSYMAEFLASRWSPGAKGEKAYAAFGPENNVYTAVARNYKITKWDPGMNKTLVFSREFKPILLDDEEIQAIIEPIKENLFSQIPFLKPMFTDSFLKKVIELTDFPPRKNPVFGLLTMQDGKPLVIHDIDYKDDTATVDIFTPEGKFIGSYTHHNQAGMTRMVFKNDRAYTIETLDGQKHLVRYRYELAPK